ncbi:hypothetical protein HY604_04240 [Candidatus Peregrinibacteria bacterium]|nr:hypothetical protein [Candidatus Peregrinibacteria bacterium]
MCKLKISPTNQLAIFLSIYAILAIFFNFKIEKLAHLGITVGFGMFLYVLFSRISTAKKIPQNALITTLIIFLVLHYPLSISNITEYVGPLIATFMAIFSKFFLEKNGSPIINPTVFGILISAIIMRIVTGESAPFTSWWGTNFQGYLSLTLILIWLIFGLNRWRKLPIVITFLIFYGTILYAFQQNLTTLKFIFTDTTIFFFAAIMLVDPKTSPIGKTQQIIFAIIAATSYNLLNYLNLPFSYEPLLAIAIANFYFAITKLKKSVPSR